jgi:hypothetical protein
VKREEREAASRETLALKARHAVERYKNKAPAWLFEKRYSAAVADWPHR